MVVKCFLIFCYSFLSLFTSILAFGKESNEIFYPFDSKYLEGPGRQFYYHISSQHTYHEPQEIKATVCSLTEITFNKILDKTGLCQGFSQKEGECSYPHALLKWFGPIGVDPWCFKRLPPSFWEDRKNRREYLLRVLQQLPGKKTLDSFYALKFEHFLDVKPLGFGDRYKGQHIYDVLKDAWPHYPWRPWQFAVGTPPGFWRDPLNCRRFFEHISKEQGWEGDLSRFYQITNSLIKNAGGSLGIREHGSYAAMVNFAFPEFTFYPWKFKRVPDRYWSDKDNILNFLKYIAHEEGWEADAQGDYPPREFYKLSSDLVKQYGGGFFTSQFHASIPWLLESVMSPPEEDGQWLPFLFENGTVPKNYWQDKKNRETFLRYIAKKEAWTKDSDFYGLTVNLLRDYGGTSLVEYYRHPVYLLEDTLEGEWLPWLFVPQGPPPQLWDDPQNVDRYNRWAQGFSQTPMRPSDHRIRSLGKNMFLTAKNYREKRLKKLKGSRSACPDSKKAFARKETLRENIEKSARVLEKYEKEFPEGVYLGPDGAPDLAPYAYRGQGGAPVIVKIELSRNPTSLAARSQQDKMTASKEAVNLGLIDEETLKALLKHPEGGWVWHHHEDATTMLLVPADLHKAIPHVGGAYYQRLKYPILSPCPLGGKPEPMCGLAEGGDPTDERGNEDTEIFSFFSGEYFEEGSLPLAQ